MPSKVLRVLVVSTVFTFGASVPLPGCATGQRGPSVAQNSDGTRTVSFRVTGMACSNCAEEIASELKDVPGVQRASVDFKSSMAHVVLAAGSTTETRHLEAAVEHWRTEHFSAETDEKCLDPENRARIKQGG